jgi:hypothetical protein
MNSDVSKRSQCDMILDHLQKGYSITPMEALNRFGCFRLGARIYDLRRQGYLIEDRLVNTSGGKRVAQYYFPPDIFFPAAQ